MSRDDGLPASWLLVPLAELLTGIETGKSFKCEERPPAMGEIGVVKVSAVTWGKYQEQESKTCTNTERVNPALFVQPGDFLFSRANTIELVGACVIARQVNLRVMLSDKILRFRFAREAMNSWILSLLCSNQGRQQIEALASGNQESMRNIGQERIGQIMVPIPPEAEQSRIVDKLEELLSDLDAGVAELKAAQKKLAQYRQSLLKAAVEGRLTKAWRAQHGEPEESGAQLLARILRERRARWQAKQLTKFEAQGKAVPMGWQRKYPEPSRPVVSGLPALPQSWTWTTVDELSPDDLANGRSVPTALSGAKVLRLNALKNGAVDMSEFKLGAWSDQEAKQFAVVDGDLLIARGNGSLKLVGRAGLVAGVTQQVAYPDTMIRLRVVESVVRPAWIGLLWDAARTRDHIEQQARTSAGIYKISQPDIVSVVVPVPPLAEQDHLLAEIARESERLLATELGIEMALRQSTAQRKNILQAAFSGRLVPQDPNDEPASVLLARIRDERAAAGATKGRRGRSVWKAS